MGRPRKPPGRAVGHREHPRVELGSLAVVPLRPAPTGLLQETENWWVAFWRSPYAQIVDWVRDGQRLERLASLYDERRRSARAGKRKRLVPGSTGQPILNPLLNYVRAVDAEIRHLEDSFGMNPKAAAQLGLSIGELRKTMDDLNREANDGDDEQDDQDPRLSVAR